MKGNPLLFLILLFVSVAVKGQAGLKESLQVVVEFTENKQNLEAIRLCVKLIATYPDNADLYFLRGINHYVIRDHENAVKDFDKTVMLDPNYPDVYLYRAKAKKAGKDYMGAFRDYSKAKDKDFPQTLTSLAGDLIQSMFSGGDN